MKKIFSLLILIILPISCFEEQIPPRYFVGTEWSATESVGVYSEENKLESVYFNTHVMILGESTFSHVIYRKEAGANSLGFAAKDTLRLEGSYSLRYPDISLQYNGENTTRTGRIEFEMLTLLIEDNQHLLMFLRKTPY